MMKQLFNIGKKTLQSPKKIVPNIGFIVQWIMRHRKERYIFMQKFRYNAAASTSTYGAQTTNDVVVGDYTLHNEWKDYDIFLMKYVDESFKQKNALDFGCGPGRNIIK